MDIQGIIEIENRLATVKLLQHLLTEAMASGNIEVMRFVGEFNKQYDNLNK